MWETPLVERRSECLCTLPSYTGPVFTLASRMPLHTLAIWRGDTRGRKRRFETSCSYPKIRDRMPLHSSSAVQAIRHALTSTIPWGCVRFCLCLARRNQEVALSLRDARRTLTQAPISR